MRRTEEEGGGRRHDRSPNTDRGAAFVRDLIIGVDHAKQLGFLDCELLFDDADAPCLELAFEGGDKFIVRDRGPGISGLRGF